MISRTSFDSLKFCDTMNKLSLIYDIDEIISFIICNDNLEIEKKNFLIFLIYKFNLNYFDFQNNLPESEQKAQFIGKIRQKFNGFFEVFSAQDFEKHFEEIIILKVIKETKVRTKTVIDIITSNSNENIEKLQNFPNDLIDLFTNQIFIYSFLLVLKFKHQINFNQNQNQNTHFQSYSNSVINMELFNDLKNDHSSVKTYFMNLPSNLFNKETFLKLNNFYSIYEDSFRNFIDIYLRPNKYADKVDYEKNLHFIFAENEGYSFWKSHMILCMNKFNQKEKTEKYPNEDAILSNLSFNLLFEENLIKDFITIIRNSHIFSRKLNKIKFDEKSQQKENLYVNTHDFINFERHYILSNKIKEIFHIDENSKIMICGPNNSGKTSFIKKFTSKELIIDVDESLEVNVEKY